jgi:hypothetical protein
MFDPWQLMNAATFFEDILIGISMAMKNPVSL